MSPISQKISIFSYTDYHLFLVDYYKDQKSKNKSFSYRAFARKAQINSVGLYKDVVEGRQKLGRSLIHKFAAAMGLGSREAEYFENMVYFCEAKTADERKLYFKKMMACYYSKARKVDANQYEYYSKWYYSAIRALVSCRPFKNDFSAIACALQPSIRAEQAERAVRVLIRLGMIRKTSQGILEPADAVVTSGNVSSQSEIQKMNVVNFQKAMVKIATDAYDRFAAKRIDMSSLTLSVSRETYQAMKEELIALRKKFAAMAEKDNEPDRVYQLNVQFSPLTKIDEDA